MNKYLAALALSLTCASSFAATNNYTFPMAINYDPNNSNKAFQDCQKLNNVGCMEGIVKKELRVIKANGFSTIKTFYSNYSTYGGQFFLIAPLARDAGLKVMLGVFEFPDHPEWMNDQVERAIKQAKENSGTVVGIAVGNEDIYDWRGNFQQNMASRIEKDMRTIKSAIKNTNIPVLSAQRIGDWRLMINKDIKTHCGGTDICTNIIALSDVIGANIYPIWGKSPAHCTVGAKFCTDTRSVAQTIPHDAAELKEAMLMRGKDLGREKDFDKQVVVTEEGWSSKANPATQPEINASLGAEIDYFEYWKTLQAKPDHVQSFYFQFYDKVINPKDPNNWGADLYFGLCNASQPTTSVKSPRLASTC